MKPETYQTQIKAIYSAMNRVIGAYNRWSRKRADNQYTIEALYLLLTEGPITQKRYIEEFDVPKQSINNVILSLKKRGFIEMRQSEEDKRAKIIMLTEEGRHYATELLLPLFEVEAAVARKVGEPLMSQLTKALTIFSDTLESEFKLTEKREI